MAIKGARKLRLIIIDDSPVEYAGGYTNIDVVECGKNPEGKNLDRVGTWRGLIHLILKEGIPPFDLLLYDISFQDDPTICPVSLVPGLDETNRHYDDSRSSNDEIRRSGGVGSLGMDLALAVIAGRRRITDMPMAHAGFTAYRDHVINDRHAIHVYGLLRALEEESPTGVAPGTVGDTPPDQVVAGIRADLGRLKEKLSSPGINDLSDLLPRYRRHFLEKSNKLKIVLDDIKLSESIAALRQAASQEKTASEVEEVLGQVGLDVFHSDDEESLNLRSLFAEYESIAGADLFVHIDDQNAYETMFLDDRIDQTAIGPGDFLEILRIIAQYRDTFPVVRDLIRSIDLRVAAGIDQREFFVEELTKALGSHGSAIPRHDNFVNQVVLTSVFIAWLDWFHNNERAKTPRERKRPKDPRDKNHHKNKHKPVGVVTYIRTKLQSNEKLPERYLKDIGYPGGYEDVIGKLVSHRLPAYLYRAGKAYWRDLNKEFFSRVSIELIPKDFFEKPIVPPPCLQKPRS